MTPWVKSFIDISQLIGEFTLNGDSIEFDTTFKNSNGTLMRNYFVDVLGDVVYIFTLQDKSLIKIGKASGNEGFYSRQAQYCKGYKGDKTNKKIINYMRSVDQSKILVYATNIPRAAKISIDKKSGKKRKIFLEEASHYEREWIIEAREAGETLPGSQW